MTNPLTPESLQHLEDDPLGAKTGADEQGVDDTDTEASESPFEGEISDGDAIDGNGIMT